MADIYDSEKRKQIMSAIGSRNTRLEVLVRKFLFHEGFRYRKNVNLLPGKPDIVLPKYKTVILVHGCFWHGHAGCQRAKLPETRREFWVKKIGENIERDKKHIEALKKLGWKVIIVWQDEIANLDKRKERLRSLEAQIRSTINYTK